MPASGAARRLSAPVDVHAVQHASVSAPATPKHDTRTRAFLGKDDVNTGGEGGRTMSEGLMSEATLEMSIESGSAASAVGEKRSHSASGSRVGSLPL